MHSNSFVLATVLVAAAGWAGCQSSGPVRREEANPLPPLAPKTSDLTSEEWESGTRLYVAKCARCHKFYNPADYREVEWRSWVTKMSRKARLESEQKKLLSRYLETFRTGQQSGGKPPGL